MKNLTVHPEILSNMTEYSGFRVGKTHFRSTEAFFQAMKTKDEDLRHYIGSLSAFEARAAGKRVTLRRDWDSIKIDVMLYALERRWKYDVKFRKALMATEGPIVHYNHWNDNFWGHCTCENCKSKQKHDMLGKLLTHLRDVKRERIAKRG